MVACMPACASFSRYFLGKSGIISTIRSRLSSPRNSRHRTKFSQSRATILVSTPASESEEDPGSGRGNYWKIKNPFSKGKDGAAPQITMNQQRSHVLQTGEFRVFDEGTKTKRGSFELKESPGEKREGTAPYDMV